jgi:hypothetical protein
MYLSWIENYIDKFQWMRRNPGILKRFKIGLLKVLKSSRVARWYVFKPKIKL